MLMGIIVVYIAQTVAGQRDIPDNNFFPWQKATAGYETSIKLQYVTTWSN
jgi:hypothetical protein